MNTLPPLIGTPSQVKKATAIRNRIYLAASTHPSLEHDLEGVARILSYETDAKTFIQWGNSPTVGFLRYIQSRAEESGKVKPCHFKLP